MSVPYVILRTDPIPTPTKETSKTYDNIRTLQWRFSGTYRWLLCGEVCSGRAAGTAVTRRGVLAGGGGDVVAELRKVVQRRAGGVLGGGGGVRDDRRGLLKTEIMSMRIFF